MPVFRMILQGAIVNASHSEISATPRQTKTAPVQRVRLTFSRSKYFAATVSTTYVLATAGAAQLTSARVSSARKLKNAIPLEATPSQIEPFCSVRIAEWYKSTG